MIWLDLVIIAILGYNIAVGLLNGLVRSLFNLAALVGAFLLAPALKIVTIPLAQSVLKSNELLAVPIGMGLAWVMIYLLISIIGLLVLKIIKKSPVEVADRIGGVLFGLLVSAVLILLPIIFVESIPMLRKIPAVQQTLSRSVLLPFINPVKMLVRNQLSLVMLNYWKNMSGEALTPPSPSPKPKAVPSPAKASPKGGKSK